MYKQLLFFFWNCGLLFNKIIHNYCFFCKGRLVFDNSQTSIDLFLQMSVGFKQNYTQFLFLCSLVLTNSHTIIVFVRSWSSLFCVTSHVSNHIKMCLLLLFCMFLLVCVCFWWVCFVNINECHYIWYFFVMGLRKC